MKHFKRICDTALLLSLLSTPAALAQFPSVNFGGSGGGMGADFATMSKLFGSHTGFTAKTEVRMYDKSQKEAISAVMRFAYLEGKTRIEIDTAQMKNKDLPAGIAAQLKQMGMDQVVTLIRPDRKAVYVLFPKLEACLTQPLAKESDNAKLDKQPVGKETLDGHPCVKHQVTLTSAKGEKEELTVWNATDLKEFPVQVLVKQKDETVITRYKEIQLEKPEAKLFDVPAGFKEYTDTASLMQGIMARILDGGLPESK